MAKGKYVFVMDSDDWAMPERLEAQIDALEYIPNLLACGCTHEDFNNIICYRTLQYSGLKVNLLLNNSFLHPSLAIRKDILHQINYYNEKYVYASDYDLACRLSLCGKVINLPDILMKYRAHENRISSLHSKQQTAYADGIRINYLHACGFVLNKQQESIFTGFMKNPYILNAIEIQELKDELHKQNSELKYFKSEYLDSLFDSSTYE